MEATTFLDRLESGGSVAPDIRVPDVAPAFFERLAGYFGTDNERLLRLGRHWRDLLPLTEDPAWIYRAGGIYERAQGEWQASADAFLAAGAHAKDALAKSSFQVGAIDSLGRSGKVEEAQRLAARLRMRLKELGEGGLAARAMLNLGNVLVYQDRMPEARRVLRKALPELAAAGLRLEAASAKLAISSTHLFGGDPRMAALLAEEVVAESTALQADYLTDLARLNIALALIVTGQGDKANEILLELRPRLESSPADAARVEEYLGDSLLQLNLWNEAEETYRQLLTKSEQMIPLHRANVELGLGQSLLAQGRNLDAAILFARAGRGYARLNNRVWQAVTLHFQAAIDLEAGKRGGLAKLTKAEALAGESPYHLCQILLTQSKCGIDRIDEAYALIRRNGYLDLEWQVHHLRAQKAKAPAVHYRRMFKSVLVGRMATRSLAARIGFLKDKERALQDYLAWLLSKPTAQRVRETISVVEQVRSATLIDEILQHGAVPAGLVETFDRLREEIGSSLDQAPNGYTRLQPSSGLSMSRAQKAVTEGLMTLAMPSAPSHRGQVKSVILAETRLGLHVLEGSRALRPALPDRQIQDLLRWLPFELMAPMADRNADPEPAVKLLSELGAAFQPLWNLPNRLICPDGASWRIPWSLCGALSGGEGEWAVAMHPRMSGRFAGPLTRQSKAMVWLGETADLPFSGKEADAIAAKFELCRVVGTAAEARASLSETVDVIHVVSHAIHRPQNPMLSSIEFPDGPVFATEIARSGLKVRLATLSACETGSISIQTRSEPDGLARAFLARGAHSTVASQWPLDDEAAYLQFLALYDALLEGQTIEEALIRAKCICRGWQPHPYYWGALALYSGYST